MTDYLKKLCENLVHLRKQHKELTIQVETHGADLSLDQAVTLGLITIGLVANVLKHAFPDPSAGKVTIRFGCTNGDCTWVVSENGVGIQPGMERRNVVQG